MNNKNKPKNILKLSKSLIFIFVVLTLLFSQTITSDANGGGQHHPSLTLIRHQYQKGAQVNFESTWLPALDQAIDQVVKEELAIFKINYATPQQLSMESEWNTNISTRTFLTNNRFVGMMVKVVINHENFEEPYQGKRAINFDLFRDKPINFQEIFTNSYLAILKQQALAKGFSEAEVNEAIAAQQLILANQGVIMFAFNHELTQKPKTKTAFIPYTDLQTSMRQVIVPSVLPIRLLGSYSLNSNRDIDPNFPIVALTFDDGPARGTTKILDVFEKYNVVGTFYVVGSRVNSYPSVIKRIVETNSEIANHSYNHPMFARLSAEQVFNEIDRTNLAIYNLTGVVPRTFRPPYGSFNNATMAAYPNIRFVMWSLDTMDWSHRNATQTYQRVVNQVKDGDIILMHDLVASTADAVEDIVKYLLSKNFQLVTVSELIEIRNIRSQLVYSGR